MTLFYIPYGPLSAQNNEKYTGNIQSILAADKTFETPFYCSPFCHHR